MPTYVPIAGTWAKKQAHRWTDPDSLFDCHLQKRGFIREAAAFGFWSTALAGTFFSGPNHLAWQFGGQQLYLFLCDLPYQKRNLFGHSHAGAVIAYALAMKPAVTVRSVVTIDSPMPRSLDPVWHEASKTIGVHVHLYGSGMGSKIRWFGQRGRFKRQMDWADHNIHVDGGHSGVVRDAKHIPQIDEALMIVRDAAA